MRKEAKSKMKANVDLLDLYNNNKKFKTYVDKYAKKHNKLFPEDCFFDVDIINYADRIRKRTK